MLESLLKWFRPKEEKIFTDSIDFTKPTIYPLDFLEKYVGQTIEVHYINQGQEVIAKDKLKCKPTPEFFYLEFHIKEALLETIYEGYSQILWNRPDTQGREFKVLSIKDNTGNSIYQSDK